MKDLKHIRRFNESEENLNISDVISSKKFNNNLTAENIYNFLLEQVSNSQGKRYDKYITDDEDIARKLLNDLSLEIGRYIHKLKLDKY